jgi:TldD protein
MTTQLVKPERFFLEKFGLTERHLELGLGAALGKQIDFADLYFEYRISEAISLEEGMIKRASKNISQGVGVRALAGEKTGYAFSDEISVENLQLASSRAKEIAERAGAGNPPPVRTGARPPHDLYPIRIPPVEIPVEQKIDLLHRIDAIARKADSRIVQVMGSFSTEYKIVLVATSAGVLIGDIQPLSRLNITCIAQEGDNRQMGTCGGGGRGGFEFFEEDGRFERYAKEAARLAIINLSAAEAPAGTMDVVLGPGWPGVLLHEAIGHGLEGDFNRKKTSAFTDRIGQRVASELVTVVDDGTIPLRRGSLNMDDEGTPTGRTILIERGILRGYMQDRLNARLMGMQPTGNGRRESYAYQPMPRMTNTFMLAGDSTSEEVIASVKRGLYAVTFGGGQVDITSGKFVFSASEAYLIENGKIARPVKGATLIGHGPEVLTRVSMVGNDLKLDEGIGTCGKDGQMVPVGVGLPTIKVEGLTVGGTQSLAKGEVFLQ